MKNEDWDPTGYYTKKLETRRHEPAVVGVCVVAMIIIALVAVFATPAYSQDAPIIPERPMVNGKQQLMELRIRRSDHCVIYRIEIDNVFYIVNTCGGIVKE